MARPISTSSAQQTASVLLNNIPSDQQLSLVGSLTTSLRSRFDEATASLAVQLVSCQADKQARQDLVGVLITQVEDGAGGTVATLLLENQDITRVLLDTATDRLFQLATTRESQTEQLEPSNKTAARWLHFVKLLAPSGLLVPGDERLIQSALKLLGSVDQVLSLAARDVTFLLMSSKTLTEQSNMMINNTITTLLSSPPKHHQTLAYTIWLRALLVSEQSRSPIVDITAAGYWKSIHLGLRHGDTERRKLCLEILKRSVATAIDRKQIEIVCPEPKASEAAVISQYSRYCTIFETVVLARYTNLVVECKKDLDLLASSSSVVKGEWLYTLLATALDTKTQDQNRRFIGNWVLDTDLSTTQSKEDFEAFLNEQYLPWVTEGHLFIASIAQQGTLPRCLHGDRVADFVLRILRQHTGDRGMADKILQTILQFVVRKQNNIFAYAAVHLLRGIGQAFAEIKSLSLNASQLEMVSALGSWRALPEVAREVVSLHCWRIYELSDDRTGGRHRDGISSLAEGQLAELKADIGPIVSPDATSVNQEVLRKRSQRDVAIAATIEKCNIVLASKHSTDCAQLRDWLDDIWSDLEYLEYPRELLIKMPGIFLNDKVVEAALREDVNALAGVRAFLRATLPRLHSLAQRRSFLLGQLIPALRRALLLTPRTAGLFDIEDFVLQIARDPPEASIDLRIEYATLPLLSEVLPSESDATSRYFGPGEGVGFAAYLDLISRLGEVNPSLIDSILMTLLARWKRQKTPVPVLSGWKTTLQLQVMLLCLEQHTPTAGSAVVEATLEDLYHILSIEPLPRYRYLLEWMIVRIQIQSPTLRSHTLQLLSTKDHHSNPKFLASLMKIGVMLMVSEARTEGFAVELASVFIGLSASSKIVIRHEAQWSFPILIDRARERKWDTITQNPAYIALDDYIRSLPRFGDPPPERAMSKLDPRNDSTLTHLADGPWTGLDSTRPPFATHDDFLTLYEIDRTNSTSQWPASCLDLGSPAASATKPAAPTPPKAALQSSALPEPSQQEPTALQTKGTAYLKTASLADPSSDTPHHHELLLIASLIKNPYNLGGLSRCGEIFGASALYVRDSRVTADKDFTSVAVSSHNHLPILPLPLSELSTFLQNKKIEGWTVVGIEQTDRSVLLGEKECVLPEKTILVLGSEREGMPAMVLGECDLLVEIPQVGVTRSLNVQTAAAIVLFEYGRQRKHAGGSSDS